MLTRSHTQLQGAREGAEAAATRAGQAQPRLLPYARCRQGFVGLTPMAEKPVYICMCRYTYVYTSILHTNVCVYVHICICIYIHIIYLCIQYVYIHRLAGPPWGRSPKSTKRSGVPTLAKAPSRTPPHAPSRPARHLRHCHWAIVPHAPSRPAGRGPPPCRRRRHTGKHKQAQGLHHHHHHHR